MKKILLFTLVIFSFLNSIELDVNRGCCGVDYDLEDYSSIPIRTDLPSERLSYLESPSGLTAWHDSHEENPDGNTISNPYCESLGVKKQYLHGSYSSVENVDGIWTRIYELYYNVNNYNCTCNQPSDPAPDPVPPAPLGYVWDISKMYSKDCIGNEIGTPDAYLNENNLSLKYETSQYIGCCGTTITYYVASAILPCPDGEERINGECAVNPLTCPTDTLDNGIRNETECIEAIQNGGGSGSWLTQDDIYYKCCIANPPPPQFECIEKGDNWSLYGATDIDDCQSVVNGTSIVEASWESGTDISPTCCILNADNNDTETPDNNDTETPDNNDTETPDNNDTETPDNNNSDLDDTNDKLDDLNDKTNDTNDKLDDLNDKTNDTNEKLDTANGTLEDIKNNTAETNEQLTSIKDILTGENEEGIDKSKELEFDGAMSAVNEFRSMVSEGFNNVRNTFKDAPQLSPSQSQCDFSFTLSSGTNINVDVHSYIVKLRPYLDIIWTFLFALIGFKIYLYVFVKITEFLR